MDKIKVGHLNIRQSIVILLAKLVLIDIVAVVILIGAYMVLVRGEGIAQYKFPIEYIYVISLAVVMLAKIAIDIYVVLLWLNEYYEITPEYIIHKKGVMFRKTEKYRLDKVRVIDVQDTFLGELFNFATITLFDIRLNRYLDLYLIHNPRRYATILKTLNPLLEERKDHVQIPFMPEEDLIEEGR